MHLWNGKIDGDWSYIYFIVPSCLSFLVSLILLICVTSSAYYRIPFYQYNATHSALDILQAASWFLGPRYHTSGTLCKAQEYVFQFTTLCKLINTVLVVGSAYALLKTKVLNSGWTRLTFILSYLSAVVCLLFSVIFDSAVVFCPFEHDNFYAETLPDSDIKSERIAYIVTFLGPIVLQVIVITIFAVRTIMLSRQSYPEHIRKKYVVINFLANQLIYVLVLIYVFFLPIYAFYWILTVFGKSVTILAKMGACSVSSTGLITGTAYFICVKKYHKLYLNNSMESHSGKCETTNPIGYTIQNKSDNSQYVSSAPQYARMTFFTDEAGSFQDKDDAVFQEFEFKRTAFQSVDGIS
jgi:hypothetical protein